MSTAHNSGHWFPPLARAALVAMLGACAGDDEPRSARREELLARAQRLDGDPAAALVELPSVFDAAVAQRRAELLDRLGRTVEARAELARAIAMAPDVALLAQARLYDVSIAARAADATQLARVFGLAPITEHPALAHRAAADAVAELTRASPKTASNAGPNAASSAGPNAASSAAPNAASGAAIDKLTALAAVNGELARAIGDQLESTHGPAAALAPRERAISAMPDDADAWDAVARSRIAAGRVDDALAAWDRAAQLVPAQEAFRITPVRALVIAGLPDRAKARAVSLGSEARAAKNVELLVAASAAAAIVEPALALSLAQTARELRPGDGRIAFLVGQRLAEAGDRNAAARAYVNLLVCGAHGRPWHRHEVAARLDELGDLARAALAEAPSCDPVEPADLAKYVDALRAIP